MGFEGVGGIGVGLLEGYFCDVLFWCGGGRLEVGVARVKFPGDEGVVEELVSGAGYGGVDDCGAG